MAKPVAPIHVNRCHAQKLAIVLPGFDPAYYPVGPYYWNDVYGQRFIQPPILDNPTLSIDFVNSTKKVARVVEFGLVARGHQAYVRSPSECVSARYVALCAAPC